MSAVEAMITRNDTMQTLKSELQKACSFLPGLKDECYDVMGKFAPGIAQYVGKQLRMNELCTNVGLCKA